MLAHLVLHMTPLSFNLNLNLNPYPFGAYLLGAGGQPELTVHSSEDQLLHHALSTQPVCVWHAKNFPTTISAAANMPAWSG